MLRILSRLIGWNRLKASRHMHPDWDVVFTKLKSVERGFLELHNELSRKQDELWETIALLEDGREEYLSLYRSRLRLLRQLAEELMKYERQGYWRIAQNLEEILLEEGIERFEPAQGTPIVAGKCVVDADMETDSFPAGSVAMCRAPGFCTADDVVVLKAHVYRSVPPPEKARDKIVLTELADPESLESTALVHLLLSGAPTDDD